MLASTLEKRFRTYHLDIFVLFLVHLCFQLIVLIKNISSSDEGTSIRCLVHPGGQFHQQG